MTEQQHIFELIEDYLHDRMTGKERIAFEEQMAQDEALQFLVSEARATDEAIRLASLSDLKATIGQDIKKIKYDSGPGLGKPVYFFIAALVTVASFTVYWMSGTDSPVKEKALTQRQDKKRSPDRTAADKKYDPLKDNDPAVKENKQEQKINTEDIQNPAPESDDTENPVKEPDGKSEDPEKVTPEIKADPAGKAPLEKPVPDPVPYHANECDRAFEIRTEPACKQKETGRIFVSGDGSRKFNFQLNEYTASGNRGDFGNLPAGEYKLVVTYEKGCTFSKAVTVAEKWCPLNSSFSFNPDFQEKWIIRYEEGAHGTVNIYDRSGKEIFKTAFGSGDESWDGTNAFGNVVPMGAYFAIISYSDGRKEKVELTIVR